MTTSPQSPADKAAPAPGQVHPYVRVLEQAFTAPRLQSYRRSDEDADDLDAAARYLWNVALCEAWYPTLNMVEVAIRNRIDAVMTAEFPVGGATGRRGLCWIDAQPTVLAMKEERIVADVLENSFAKRRISVTQDKLVTELNFGFWTSLFDRRYEDQAKCPVVLWPRLSQKMFPLMPPSLRTRGDMIRYLEEIRYVRNRAFHHESLVKKGFDVEAAHKRVLEFFGWLRPALLSTLLVLDRFPEVHAAGRAAYRAKAEHLAATTSAAAAERAAKKMTRQEKREAKAAREAAAAAEDERKNG